jgi:hypothetical protein
MLVGWGSRLPLQNVPEELLVANMLARLAALEKPDPTRLAIRKKRIATLMSFVRAVHTAHCFLVRCCKHSMR